jgi:large subunit ribosomal protein L12
MESVYAALLLHKLNKEVNEENLKKVLQAAGAQPDEVKTKALVAALSEVNIDEALKSAVVAPAPAAAAPAEAAPKEAKKEEKKEEEKEEEALAGLSSLFG